MIISESKLALGTANFGLNYGISNNYAQIKDEELQRIIKVVNTSCINMLDTAQIYGNSEERIGKMIEPRTEVVTKFGIGIEKQYETGLVHKLFFESIRRLKVKQLYGLLLHRPEVLLSRHGKNIATELEALKKEGLVKKIGISIYDPNILSDLPKVSDIDIVQLPFNLLDQRILSSGWVEKLQSIGTEIHTRSTFLQGLLLMKQNELPHWFYKNWPSIFNKWYEIQKEVKLGAEELALSFVLKHAWVDRVIVGVDTAGQLIHLLEIANKKLNFSLPSLESNDIKLLDPSKWSLD